MVKLETLLSSNMCYIQRSLQRSMKGLRFVIALFTFVLVFFAGGYLFEFQRCKRDEQKITIRNHENQTPSYQIMREAKPFVEGDNNFNGLLWMYNDSEPQVLEELLPFSLLATNKYGLNYYDYVYLSLLEIAAVECAGDKASFPLYTIGRVDSVTTYIGLIYLMAAMRKSQVSACLWLNHMYERGLVVRKDVVVAQRYHDVRFSGYLDSVDYLRLLNIIEQNWPAKHITQSIRIQQAKIAARGDKRYPSSLEDPFSPRPLGWGVLLPGMQTE